MIATLLKVLLTFAALYVLGLSLLYTMQRGILFLPDKDRPDPERAGAGGVQVLTVTTEDGLPLLAWYQPPPSTDGLVVLYLHGNAGHIGHRGFRLPRFASHGWGAMLLEYRGFGGNPGKPSEDGFRADARAALAALHAMGIPNERIVLWGESLGTGVAVGLAAGDAVAAVILESPYTSIRAIAQKKYPYAPVSLLLKDPFDSLSRIGGLKAPVMIIHGAQDEIVPVEMGRALHAAAPEPKALWIAAQTGHGGLVEAGAIEAAAAFIAGLPAARDRQIGHDGPK